MATLLGAVGLGTDIAVLYFNWMQLQKAADASALAGAGYLPANPNRATTTAQQYAGINGIQPSEIVSTQVAGDDLSITVTLSRTVPYYFLRVLGLTTGKVGAAAAAAVRQGAGSVHGGLLPVAVQYTHPCIPTPQTTCAPGQQAVLHGGGYGPGNWGAVALGCRGGSCYRNNLASGYSGVVSVGDILESEPGAKVGPTDQGISQRLSAGQAFDSNGTWDNHSLGDPRAVTIPMVDWTGCEGRCSVPVKGFAEIWLLGANGPDINAIFIKQTASATVTSDAPQTGVYQPILVK
jgi:hypothetical protein